MGTEKDSWKVKVLNSLLVSVVTASFCVGAFASRTESQNTALTARIDNVQAAARSELSSAIALRQRDIDSMEKRLTALETMARENAAVNQAVLQELSSIRTELKYLNRSSDELKAQVSAITTPPKRLSASGE